MMPDSAERFVTPNLDAFVNYWQINKPSVAELDACQWLLDPEAFTATIHFGDNDEQLIDAYLQLKPWARWQQLAQFGQNGQVVDTATVLQLHESIKDLLTAPCGIEQLIGAAMPFNVTMRPKIKPFAGFGPRLVTVRVVGVRKNEAQRSIECLVSLPGFDLIIEEIQAEFETRMRRMMGMTPLIGRFEDVAAS